MRNSRLAEVSKTTEVGSYKPNAWGLCDMHGNVYEWCGDWYVEKLAGGRDPLVAAQPAGASYRVVRGGCWFDDGGFCRSAYRSSRTPGNRRSNAGFRLAAVQSR